MTTTTAAGDAGSADAGLWQPEWWERLRERRAGWAQRHIVWLKRLLIARLVLLAAGIGWLIFAVTMLDAGKPVFLSVWFGVVWIIVIWFLMLRTKTLTFAGYLQLFVVCVGWSVLTGLILKVHAAGTTIAIQEEGAYGPRIAIASLGEESFKLLPVVAIVLLAPGRVRRFGVADWALLGMASGAAFMATEELFRRLAKYAPQTAILDTRYDLTGFDEFGLFGLAPPLNDAWPGHHIVTMLVTTSVGLAIAGWRASRGRQTMWRAFAAVGAVALVVATFWSAVTHHAYLNLIDEDPEILPGVLRAWRVVMPDEYGAGWMLLLVVVAITAVDAHVLRRWGGWTVPVEAPTWAAHLDERLATSTTADDVHPVLARFWTRCVDVARSLVFVTADTARGVVLFLAAGAREPGEPWWAGPRRAQASVVMNRQSRELAYHLDAPTGHAWLFRLLAVAVTVVFLWLTYTVGPDWVEQIQDAKLAEILDTGWLSQLFKELDLWWSDLSGWEKTLAIGTVVVLSGGTLAFAGASAGTFILGSAAWGSGAFTVADNAGGLADFSRDPIAGVKRYWAEATPGSVLLDTATVAFTFWAPSRLAAPVHGKIDNFVRDRKDWTSRHPRRDLEEGDAPPTTVPPRKEPGAWGAANEHMSERSAKYEEQITGAPRGSVYRVGKVKFDGFEDGVLIEAKGPGLKGFVKDGEFRSWFRGQEGFIDQARRQVRAANGVPIRWDVAEPEVAQTLDDLFMDRGFAITVRHVPAQ